jgi:ERCC4-type nuclease
MPIFLDCRETGLIELMPQSKSLNLIHGDIIIGEREDIPTFVIERKTLQDLSASITDSRFREQKSRLVQVYSPSQVVYIIEGNRIGRHSVPESTLRSAIVNLVFKHNFKVIHSKSLQDTVEIIKNINEKFEKNELSLDNAGTGADYGKDTIGFTLIKKSKVSIDNALACQLNSIPGVSTTVATALQTKFVTMKALVDGFETPTFLADILITEKRKIGNALSMKIHTALFGV